MIHKYNLKNFNQDNFFFPAVRILYNLYEIEKQILQSGFVVIKNYLLLILLFTVLIHYRIYTYICINSQGAYYYFNNLYLLITIIIH